MISCRKSRTKPFKYYRTMNETQNIDKSTKKVWSIGVVIMCFLLVVTSPIVNVVWLLLIITEFISKLICESKLSKK